MAQVKDPLSWQYPVPSTFSQGTLSVGGGHELYFEESGNPNGKPVVFVHGGPGGGVDPDCRRFFNPERYRIILFDQRGSGRSTPHASLEANTTWDLVADMEKLREHLKLERWQVFGGSWGSTLALSYAVTHPERVTELVLRGIFLIREAEIRWFYQEGASWIYPDAWEKYLEPIPKEERGDLLSAYHKRLTSEDEGTRLQAAQAWSIWEGSTSKLFPPSLQSLERFGDPRFALAFARIECHYFKNKGFFEYDGWLLDQVTKIKDIPTVIVQGRYDVVCPMKSAWDLHNRLPKAELFVIPDAGHSAFEAGISRALISATDRFAERG